MLLARNPAATLLPVAAKRQSFTTGDKVKLWLTDVGETVNSFAAKHAPALKQRSLNRWVAEGGVFPVRALAVIAAESRLPVDYWLDTSVTYPPPAWYLRKVEDAIGLISSLDADSLDYAMKLLRDPDRLRRVHRLEDAANDAASHLRPLGGPPRTRPDRGS
jgi:hypothetical protein